ncbi:MAG: hypothetical protein HY807_07905 [Nitrospirae bacterium]|nr:hypothetical protein [Nitrospirota bacterium]
MKFTINRPAKDFNMLHQYYIFLDGIQIGQIERGEEKTFETSDEEHELYLTIEGGLSNSVKLDPKNGHKKFECKDRLGIWCSSSLLSLWSVTFGRKKYLKLIEKTR